MLGLVEHWDTFRQDSVGTAEYPAPSQRLPFSHEVYGDCFNMNLYCAVVSLVMLSTV